MCSTPTQDRQRQSQCGRAAELGAGHEHPDPLRSNGLPFVLSSFTLDARIASMDAEDTIEAGRPAPMQPGFTPCDESAVSPLVLDVMSYANR